MGTPVLSLLTLNIQAAALPRARMLLGWLEGRGEDLFILTETTTGPGTTFLLEQCRRAGLSVVHTAQPGERGCALISRIPVQARPDLVTGVTASCRVAAATVTGYPNLVVLGVYVPSSDRAPDKVARKRAFLTSLLAAVDQLPPPMRQHLVLGGDYNVITRDHQPSYRGFRPFEYAMLDALHGHGLVDAHQHCHPGVQAHSWIGRGGNGYRFDYFHVGAGMAGQITDCDYLHEPREQGLSDHAAATLTLDLAHLREPVDGQVRAGRTQPPVTQVWALRTNES